MLDVADQDFTVRLVPRSHLADIQVLYILFSLLNARAFLFTYIYRYILTQRTPRVSTRWRPQICPRKHVGVWLSDEVFDKCGKVRRNRRIHPITPVDDDHVFHSRYVAQKLAVPPVTKKKNSFDWERMVLGGRRRVVLVEE
jgi:hypothetical protein